MASRFHRTWVMVALIAVMATGCGGDDGDGARATSTTVTTTATTVAVPVTSTTLAAARTPPWSGPKLRADQVPPVLLREWRAGGARPDCAAIAPADLGRAAAGAPRRADFGAGAWAVAWDVPGAPGRLASGEPCADCGRGTVVVAGTAVELPPGGGRPAGSVLTNERRWSDASVARYGLEGGTGPAFLAQLEIVGQRCLYNVSTFLGQAHLELLLESLRFVEGAP